MRCLLCAISSHFQFFFRTRMDHTTLPLCRCFYYSLHCCSPLAWQWQKIYQTRMMEDKRNKQRNTQSKYTMTSRLLHCRKYTCVGKNAGSKLPQWNANDLWVASLGADFQIYNSHAHPAYGLHTNSIKSIRKWSAAGFLKNARRLFKWMESACEREWVAR